MKSQSRPARQRVTPYTWLALLSAGVVSLSSVGLLLPREDVYADGAAAIRNVSTLRPGMDFVKFATTLHRKRMDESESSSFGLFPAAGGQSEQIHALTRDRYLVSRWKPRDAKHEPRLISWTVRKGRAPREDVKIDRVLRFGPLRLRY